MPGEVDTTARSGPLPRFRMPGDQLRGAALAGDPLSDPLSRPVQANGGSIAGPFAPPQVQSVATAGVGGSGEPLPHAGAIQSSFGHHDIGGVRAHTGPDAKGAAASLGTTAYATGNDVALGSTDLRTVAHEAAHTVQQARGVQLNGGIGAAGDVYERQADAAADAVVSGRSAEGILDQGGGGGSTKGVQGLFGFGRSAPVAPAPAGGGAPPLGGGAPAPAPAPAPTITPGGKADAVTVAGDAASVLQSGGALGVKGATMVGGMGEAAMEGIGVASDILGWAGVGLGIFGIAENAVRGRDAHIRLGVFTRAWSALPANDPMRPYLQDAAKQQSWERSRRMVRVAVTAAIVALSMTALIVGTGGVAGVVIAAVAGVLALAKGIETIRNFFAKRAARKRQEEVAREMLSEGLAPTATAQRREAIEEMLTGLSIPVPRRIREGGGEAPEFTHAVTKLAPHLSRADETHKVQMQDQATEWFQNVMIEADAAIAAAGPTPPARPQIA